MTKMEPLVVTGELIQLTPAERIQFYIQTCESMGLNPLTRPLQYFEQIDRNGKRNLILYALRVAAAQLRKLHNLSVTISPAEYTQDAVMFTATVTNHSGATDSAVGAESLKGLVGKEYADRIMAAQTKAKRRAILDYVGSGLLDESEVEGMNGAVVEVTENDLKGYVPIPSAPTPVAASAPAKEVVDPRDPVNFPNIDPKVIQAGNKIIDNLAASIKPLVEAASQPWEKQLDAAAKASFSPDPPFVVVPPPQVVSNTEQEITSRLNVYRRDIIQQGGMRPSKGLGIAAKWSKFLAKKAPNKTAEEYTALLSFLDDTLKNAGPAAVVNFIEQEIA